MAGFINTDIFIISAKDLTQDPDKVYLDMSTDKTLLKADAPKLWNIYNQGAETFTISKVLTGNRQHKVYLEVK